MRTDSIYFIPTHQKIKQFKKTINPIFKTIKKSKYIWSNCLSSAILLWLILRRNGLDTQIVIGTQIVTVTETDRKVFKAHAWVEYNNFPLNENKKIRDKYHAFEYDFSNKIIV